MGTVKKTETGSVLSFNTYLPKNLDETKISFTPKQSGSGTPSPENVREIVGKNSVSVWVSGDERARPLPSDYQQVEYIYSSTKKEWIDTGVIPTTKTVSQLKFRLSTQTGYVVYGYYTNSDATDYRLFITNSKVYFDVPGFRLTSGTITPTGVIHEMELGNYYVKDIPSGETIVSGAGKSFECDNTITLNSYNGTQIAAVYWYYVKIYESGTLIRDLVPCYRKSDSVAGMYDLVSGTFYTNSGTGEFLVGEDIVGVETSVSFPSITKNLLDSTKRKDGYYIDNTGKEIANAQFGYTTAYTPVEPNETYVLSGNIGNHGSAYGAIYCYDENKNFVNRLGGFKTNEVPHTFTVPSDTYYINIQYFNNQTALTDAQIEKGSTATAYEPFDNTVYGGYVDLASGEIWETHIGYDIDSLAPGLGNPDSYDGETGIRFTKIVSRTSSIDSVICNILPTSKYNNSSSNKSIEWVTIGRSGTIDLFYGCVNANRLTDTTITSVKDYLRENGFFILLKLRQPELVATLPPTILTTLQGVNTMWSDGDELTISYTDDVVNTYDFRRHISLDTPHKASASGAVASFGTDMVGKMKCKIHFLPQQEGSGTPSPENVRNLSGRDNVKLWQTSENLIDITAPVGEWPDLIDGKRLYTPYRTYKGVHYSGDNYHSNSTTYEQVGNGFTFTTSNISYGVGVTFCIPPNTNVRGSFTGENANFERIRLYDNEWNYIGVLGNILTDKKTVPSNARYGIAVFTTRTPNELSTVTDFTLVIGTEIPEHLPPHTGNEITFSWGSNPEIGTIYGGYVDCETADLVVEYAEKILTGDENWQLNAWNGNGVYMRTLEQGGISAGLPFKMGQAYGNMLSYNYNGLNPVVDGSFAVFGADTIPNYTYLVIYNTAWGTTLEEYKAKLKELYEAGTPLTIVAPLKTAYVQHYSLTPQSIATLRGSNRLWSDSDSVEVEYYKHTDEPQEYIPAEVLGTGNIAIVTSDGYLIGEEQDYIKY